jgi:hypothetical protein
MRFGGVVMRIPIVTESDWHEAAYPMNMFRFLGESASDRKKDLLVAACFRRIWHLLKTERGWRAVEVLEQFVEGNATAEQLAAAKEDAWESTMEIPNPEGNRLPEVEALGAIALHESRADMIRGAEEATAWVKVGTGEAIREPERKSQCALVREIFGNPFRPVSVEPSWLTPSVLALAQTAYEQRALPSGHLDADRMAVLADALEDAGCDNPDILSHCRQPDGIHYRGCWVLDLILGRQ